MDVAYIRRLNYWLVGIISCALILALSVIVVASLRIADKYVVPELEAKAVTQGQALAALIGQPLSYGIDIRELIGVDELFKDAIRENPEFGLLAVSGTSGEMLFSLGSQSRDVKSHISNPELLAIAAKTAESGIKPKAVGFAESHIVSLPIYSKDRSIAGLLHIGVKSSYVQNILRELLLDLAVILIVSLFVAYEILYFISGGKLAGQFELLTGVMGRVANKDFTRMGPHIGRDELGRVATLVNEAISRVNARFSQLAEKARQAGILTSEMAGRGGEELLAIGGVGTGIRFGEAGGRSSRYTSYLGSLRAPLFLSLMAEDLSRSFIPLYAKHLYTPIPGVPAEFSLALPIMIFMLLVALLQPVIAGWSERVGRKHSLLTGVLIGCLAFVMTANAFSIYDLLIWRALSGISWAIVFVASQGLILDNATPDTRTRDIAFFVGVIMVSMLCGPPIGGILADNVGFKATFYAAAFLSLFSAILLFRYLPSDEIVARATPRKLGLRDIMTVLANRKFLALVLTAGIPAKVILIGFCYYLIPLYVTHLGDSSAMAGRILMLYAIMMVVGVPIAAGISERMRKRKEFVGAGLLLSGVSGLIILGGNTIWAAIGIVALLGVAQAISIAPQTAFVADICGEDIERLGEGTVYGVYRLMERLGNTLGPLLAAFILKLSGFKGAFFSIGMFLIIGAVAFTFIFRRFSGPVIVVKCAEAEGSQL
jgi:predicted MFS family arabinose efflux permease